MDLVQEHRKFLDDIAVRRVKRRRLLPAAESSITGVNAQCTLRQDIHRSEVEDVGSKILPLKNYSAGEETVRNDYLVEYIISGRWNGNWIKGASEEEDECKESVQASAFTSTSSSYPDIIITVL
jgi:hypothetical protein